MGVLSLEHCPDKFAYNCLWAKKAHEGGYVEKSLVTHMIETGFVCEFLLTKTVFSSYVRLLCDMTRLSKDEVVSTVAFCIALHDIGKCHPYFQLRNNESDNVQYLEELGFFNSPQNYTKIHLQEFRHEYYGEKLIKEFLSNDGWNTRTCNVISKITAIHHQKVSGYDSYLPKEDDRLWSELCRNLYDFMKKSFNPTPFVLEKVNIDVFGMIVHGLEVCCDWLASGDVFKDTNYKYQIPLSEYKNEIFTRLENFVNMYHLSVNSVSCNGKRMKDVLPFTKDWNLNPLQCLAEKIVDSLKTGFDCALVEGEMGCGKTEIALYLAFSLINFGLTDKQGVCTFLPTSATSEVMRPRLAQVLKSVGYIDDLNDVPLFTGDAFVRNYLEKYSGDNIDDGKNSELNVVLPSSLKHMHPFAVGTVDQSMKPFMAIKHGALGIVGLFNKVLIIDEMHAYDSYMRGILKVELAWARKCHVPVIILSATLPESLKKEIFDVYVDGDYTFDKAYPLISLCSEGKLSQYSVKQQVQNKVYNVTLHDWLESPEIIADWGCNAVKDGGCASIIMNTVSSAQNVFVELKKIVSEDVQVYFFHGRLPLKEKEVMTREVVRLFGKDRSNRPMKAIVVSTQVLEQSIDVDFDYMLTAICPIDLLAQRCGRLGRHENKGTIREGKDWPLELVVVYDDESCKRVYPYVNDEVLLRRTLRLLNEEPQLVFPEKIRYYVDKVYKDNEELQAYNLENIRKSHKANSLSIDVPNRYGDFGLYALQKRNELSSWKGITRYTDVVYRDVAFVGRNDFNILLQDKLSIDDYIRIFSENVISVAEYMLTKFEIVPKVNDNICTYGKSWFSDTIIYNVDDGSVYLDENYCLVKR